LQLRIAAAILNERCGSETAPAHVKEMNMRIVEIAAAGLVALAAQMLVVATVLI
jgi:hypothetical protein